jgi:hypothetical protein
MLVIPSALISLACAFASARRLKWAVSVTWLDPRLLFEALRNAGLGGWSTLRDAVAACEGATWERDLFAALETPHADSRAALINEQLRELDWRAQRWAHVPRVCASVASSTGFLFACVVLLRAVAAPAGDGVDGVAALVPALDALAVGIAGAAFCFAVHLRARRIVRQRLADTDRLIALVEGCMVAAPAPAMGVGARAFGGKERN